MDLPAELRLEVLRHIVPGDHAIVLNDCFRDPGVCEIRPVYDAFAVKSSLDDNANLSILRVNSQIYAECQSIMTTARKTVSVSLKISITGIGFINNWKPGLMNREYVNKIVDFFAEIPHLHIAFQCCFTPHRYGAHTQNDCTRATGARRSLNHLLLAVRERQKIKSWKCLTIECDIEGVQGANPALHKDLARAANTILELQIMPYLKLFEQLRGFEAVVVRFTGLSRQVPMFSRTTYSRPHLCRLERLDKVSSLSMDSLCIFYEYVDALAQLVCRKGYEGVDFDSFKKEMYQCHHDHDVGAPFRID